MTKISENEIELFSIELLEKLGYDYVYAPDITPDGDQPERASYDEVLLLDRLQRAIRRINPIISGDVQEQAIKEVQRINSPELLANEFAETA